MVPVLVTWREETTAKPCTHTVLHDLLLGGQKPHSYKPQTPQPMSRCLPPGMSSIRIIQNLSLPCRHPPSSSRPETPKPPLQSGAQPAREGWFAHPGSSPLLFLPPQWQLQGCRISRPAPQRTALVLALLLMPAQSWCFQRCKPLSIPPETWEIRFVTAPGGSRCWRGG